MKKYLAAVTFIILSTSSLFAGPRSTPNATVAGSTEAATVNVVTDAVEITATLSSDVNSALSNVSNTSGAAISNLSTILSINGSSVEVSQNENGAIIIDGQPLVVNGLPNIGLLMRLGYS